MANIVERHGNLTINGDGTITAPLVGTGTNRLIVVIGATRGSGAGGMNSCDIGATAAADIANHVATNDHKSAASIAIFTDSQHPGAGNTDFTIDWSGGSHSGVVIYELEDAPQSAPFYTEYITLIQAEITSGSSHTQNVTGEAGKIAIALLAMGDGSFFGTTVSSSANLSNDQTSALTYMHLETADTVVADADEDYTFTVTLDSGGTPDQGVLGVLTFGEFVAASNNDPVLDSPEPDLTVSEGDIGTDDLSTNFSDADSDTLTFSISPALPTGFSFNTTTGVLSWDGSQTAQAATAYTVTADDGQGGTPATDTFNITVTAPTISIDSVSAGPYEEGDTMTVTVSNAPASGKVASIPAGGLTLDSENATTMTLTVPDMKTFGDSSGLYNVPMTLTIGDGLGNFDTVQITISPSTGDHYSDQIELQGFNDPALAPNADAADNVYVKVISGTATVDARYGAVTSDAGATIRVWYQDETDGLWGPSADYVVPASNQNAAATGSPVVTGVATEGQTLGLNTSSIADADGLGTFSYQWKRDGVDIAGATASAYTLVQADVGTQITCTISFTDGGGSNESLTTSPTSVVANVNDTPTGGVTIDNTTPTEGETLTASNTLADEDGMGVVMYQWLRDGATIAGATSSTYMLVNADVGTQISVRASYTDGQGTAETATSGPTAQVQESLEAPPTITLNGSNFVIVSKDGTYNDAGAVATDWQGNNITGSIIVGGDVVDTSVVGTYTITYNVNDGTYDAVEVTRTVVVLELSAGASIGFAALGMNFSMTL